MNIYVGNLAHNLTESELRELFEAQGKVDSAKLITDKFTGQPRGFGFVEMPDEAEAKNAIQSLQGKEVNGRPLTVNEARPRTEKPHRSSGGGFGGGRGGRGGGGKSFGGGGRRY